MKIRRILVPTDLSSHSGRALTLAARWAENLGARLTILSVVEPMPASAPAAAFAVVPDTTALDAEREKLLKRKQAALAQRFHRRGLDVRTKVVYGLPAAEIVATAETLQADLTVLATHGRSGLSRFFLGSVAENVVRTARRPVVTVRTGGETEVRLPRAVRRILVPLDLGVDSPHTIAFATDLARSFDAKLTVVTAIEPVEFALTGSEVILSSANVAILEEHERAAARRLGEIERSLRKKKLDVETVLEAGPASHVILESARRRRASLIVMATHARSGLAPGLLGSVTEKVVRTAGVPVVTLRTPDRA